MTTVRTTPPLAGRRVVDGQLARPRALARRWCGDLRLAVRPRTARRWRRGRVPHRPRARPGGDRGQRRHRRTTPRRRDRVLPLHRAPAVRAAAPDRRRDRPVLRPAVVRAAVRTTPHAGPAGDAPRAPGPVRDPLPGAGGGVRAVARAGPDAAGLPQEHGRRRLGRRPSDEMRSQLGWRGPIGLLANGADLPPLGSGSPDAQDPDRVAVFGRLVAHKRVDLVLHALDALRSDRPRPAARHHRRGTGAAARSRAWPPGSGLGHRVTFHGFVDEATKSALLGRAARPRVCLGRRGLGPDSDRGRRPRRPDARPGRSRAARLRPSGRDRLAGPGLRRPRRGRTPTDRRACSTCSSSRETAMDRAPRFEACQAWAHQFDWAQMRRQALDLVVSELPDRQETTRAARTSVLAAATRPRQERVAVMGGTTCVD